MSKQLAKLLAALVIVITCASPAFAQRKSEYNFNTCNYNFYGQANPMNGQGAAYAPVNFHKGVGTVGAAAENLKTGMNASIYQQTPQRTKTWDQMGFYNKKKVVRYQPQMQVQQSQQQYFYVPGQNGKAAQNGGYQNNSSVGYQVNSSGVASYDSASTSTTTNATNK